MGKKKQPYIPFYTGDYLKDTRTMSLQAKGAWIDIIVFMWDSETRGMIEGDLYDISRMIGASVEETDKVLKEFCRKRICEVSEPSPGVIRIISRRMMKEAEISAKRSEAVQTRYKRSTKPITKSVQNTDIDIDIDIELKKESKEKASRETEIDYTRPDVEGDELHFPIDTKPVRELWANWKKYRWEKYNLRYGMMGEQADLKRLEGMTFTQIQSTILAAISNGWKNLYPEQNRNQGNGINKKQQHMDAVRQSVASHYANRNSEGARKPDG